MTGSDQVRWGVRSAANNGRAAVNPVIQASANGPLVAVASRDADLAQALLRRRTDPLGGTAAARSATLPPRLPRSTVF